MLRSPIVVLVGLLLAAAAGLQHWVRETPPVPLPRPLAALPAYLAGWVPAGEAGAALLPRDPRADESLVRTYERGGTTVHVAVTYYGRQWDTRRLLAASVIEPPGGWIESQTSTIDLPVSQAPRASSPRAATLLMRRAEQRYALVYWYQLGDRAFASDVRYRASLLASTLFRRRSEGMLVRIAALVPSEAADPFAAQRAFVPDFYPELLRSVPL
jgi:EpsI family protein